MDQKQTLELYQEILRGAQIGMGSIDELMKKSEDVLFREEMRRTREDYQYIAFEANERIHEMGGEPQSEKIRRGRRRKALVRPSKKAGI